MSESSWLEEMKAARRELIQRSDQLVLQKFKRTNWRELNKTLTAKSPLRQQGQPRRSGGKHTMPAIVSRPIRLSRVLFLAVAGIMLILFLIMVALFTAEVWPESQPAGRAIHAQFRTQPLMTASPGMTEGPLPQVINITKVIQTVSLGRTEDCQAIRWIENGVSKARYECEKK